MELLPQQASRFRRKTEANPAVNMDKFNIPQIQQDEADGLGELENSELPKLVPRVSIYVGPRSKSATLKSFSSSVNNEGLSTTVSFHFFSIICLDLFTFHTEYIFHLTDSRSSNTGSSHENSRAFVRCGALQLGYI
jgi:hypothetical protein